MVGLRIDSPRRSPNRLATKILALKMMFYPLEFKGIRPYSAGKDRFRG